MMNGTSHQQKISVARVVSLVVPVCVFLLALFLLVPSADSPVFQIFVQRLGVWGPLALMGYIVLSQVLAPLAGAPAVAFGIAVFGLIPTLGYLYLANLVSATVNFLISRWLGRPWVERLVGRELMHRVDQFVQDAGTEVLVVGRLFGLSFFEFLSYAAGLTTMSFRRYFFVTAVCTLFPLVVLGVAVSQFSLQPQETIVLWLGGLALMGFGAMALLSWRLARKKRRCTTEDQLPELAQEVFALMPQGGVLLLNGELGAGKTTFVRNLVQVLGGEDGVTSPTFSLMQLYEVAHEEVQLVVHIDLYRLDSAEAILELGLEEYCVPGNLLCIEWAERLTEYLPDFLEHLHSDMRRISLNFSHVQGNPEQRVVIVD